MSWNDAKISAVDWLRGLNLPGNLRGQIIDLQQLGVRLEAQGVFRQMVLRAAARELRQRGATLK
jgi:hypothetical protein